ncbi:MAG TPA: M1 family metallopeptidase [Vicinamibacteria bacterium]|nr:M1 family metallopeptidase [Vicinamibacteria bacterium]
MALRALLVSSLHVATAAAALADTYPRQSGLDALHYAFDLTLTDDSDVVEGRAVLDLQFLQDGVASVALDLVNVRDGKGMTVASVRWGDVPAEFEHQNDRLSVRLKSPSVAGERRDLTLQYGGTPASGLRIGANHHGDRTFFSDNWPNRARHWLPTIDHPYDKATCELIVTAPSHYQVISNGLVVEETDLPSGKRRTHWKQSVPIATWLYVVGVARFAVDHYDEVDGRPLQSWVYSQDRDRGFRDFSYPTRQALEFFTGSIGPYAYEKLANVQSASIGGGMEAATAIFYGEDLVKGERDPRIRDIIIHEIAHQWWGNAVTEADWDDVWLSEGFATYFTLLFREHAYGRDDFVRGLEDARRKVLEFHQKEPGYRIVHENLDDMEKVTTLQTYQKGAWVLHMLRAVMGDEAFWRGIRAYYAEFSSRNATTDDFRRAMEEASGRDLARFFRQWLYRGGLPRVEGGWRHTGSAVEIELRQTQEGEPFELEIPVALDLAAGSTPRVEIVRMTGREARATIPIEGALQTVALDPQLQVLMESTFVRK